MSRAHFLTVSRSHSVSLSHHFTVSRSFTASLCHSRGFLSGKDHSCRDCWLQQRARNGPQLAYADAPSRVQGTSYANAPLAPKSVLHGKTPSSHTTSLAAAICWPNDCRCSVSMSNDTRCRYLIPLCCCFQYCHNAECNIVVAYSSSIRLCCL